VSAVAAAALIGDSILNNHPDIILFFQSELVFLDEIDPAAGKL
jgi:hypothetical protein